MNITRYVKIWAILLSLILVCLCLFSCGDATNAQGRVPGVDAGSETESDAGGTPLIDWDERYPADKTYMLTNKGIWEVGQEKNVIVLLVDRFDTRYVDLVETHQPGYFEWFKDFTFYNNNVSTYSRTYPAVTTMLSGMMQEFATDSTAEAYFELANQSSPLLRVLQEEGYAVRLYTPSYYVYRNARVFRGLVNNIAQEGDEDATCYETNDAVLFSQLRSSGLSVGHDQKSFTFLHLNGTHYPYQLDENGNAPPDKGTALGGALGVMRFVQTYIDQLKRLGVYENSTIIITGDHPDPISDYNEPTRARPTALFVKRAGESHDYRVSAAPLSDLDLMPSLLEEICPGRNFGTAYWEVAEDEDRPRYHYFLLNSKPSGNESMTVYEVTGHARDFVNWKRLYNVSLNGRIYR